MASETIATSGIQSPSINPVQTGMEGLFTAAGLAKLATNPTLDSWISQGYNFLTGGPGGPTNSAISPVPQYSSLFGANAPQGAPLAGSPGSAFSLPSAGMAPPTSLGPDTIGAGSALDSAGGSSALSAIPAGSDLAMGAGATDLGGIAGAGDAAATGFGSMIGDIGLDAGIGAIAPTALGIGADAGIAAGADVAADAGADAIGSALLDMAPLALAAKGGRMPQRPPSGVIGNTPSTHGLVRGAGLGREDKVAADLSSGEYVLPAWYVSMVGQGDTNSGSDLLDKHIIQAQKEGSALIKNLPGPTR